MPISPFHLPDELHYIIPLTELHGTDARVAYFDQKLGRHVKYGETLSSDQIESVRKLYLEIKAKNHGQVINTWHQEKQGKGTCPAETTWPVYGLLCLFAQLGEFDIAPFNDGAIRPHS